MAEYLGAKVGEWVPGNWDTLPESVRVNKFGIGNMVKGTPWTLAELEQVQGMTEAEQIAAGYLSRNPGQLAALLAEAKAAEGYYVDPQTKGVVLSKSNVPTAGQVSTSGAPLTPGLIGGVDKPFRKYWGPSSSATWGMDASGNIVQTNAPTTGEESLEETIRIASAGSRGVNALGQAGSVLTRGVSFAYDNAGNIVSATGPDGKPISVEEGKKRWENFFIDNPDQLTPSTGVGAGIRRPERQGIRYEDGVAIPSAATAAAATTAATQAAATAAAIAQAEAKEKALVAEQKRQSTIAILQDRFSKYGLTGLANKIKELAIDGATEATITLGLQETDEYKKRFKANELRIKSGLSVLQPAEYLNLEDGYRQVLRAYGLKAFDNDAYVQQFIANDVSATELSNRVVTAVQRVQNADPAVAKQLRDFYGIGSQDLVAYVLDPEQQFQKIERQVAAAEIGVAGARQGLQVGAGVAEQLAAQGISQAEAQKGYATIADILPTAEKLSEIYGKTTGVTYGQSEGEQEVFNSLASAQRARQKLTAMEVAQFSGQSGLSKAALTTQTKGTF